MIRDVEDAQERHASYQPRCHVTIVAPTHVIQVEHRQPLQRCQWLQGLGAKALVRNVADLDEGDVNGRAIAHI